MSFNQEDALKQLDTIMKVDYNNKCFDCNNSSISHVSINNAIFLCEKCAEKHKKLGKMISNIIPINDKGNWNEAKIKYLEKGGNKRLTTLLSDTYNIDKNILNNDELYKSKILSYYRKLIKAEVNNEPPPSEIQFESALDICSTIENTHNTEQAMDTISRRNRIEEAKTIFDELGNLFIDISYKNGRYGKDMIVRTGVNAINMFERALRNTGDFFKGLFNNTKENPFSNEEQEYIFDNSSKNKSDNIILDNSGSIHSWSAKENSKDILSVNSSISLEEKETEKKNIQSIIVQENAINEEEHPKEEIINTDIKSIKKNDELVESEQEEEDNVIIIPQ